ncbi:hypothetical protein BH09SUM1_BH09SUM1_19910 [soil metagenome]
MRLRPLAFSALLVLASSAAYSQTTYTWQTAPSGDFQIAANWSPARSVLATDDILVFDGGVTPTATVTNIPTAAAQVIGKLILQNGATITLESGAAAPSPANLQPSAATTDYLSVSATSTLIFGGTNPILIRPTSTTATTINGTVRFTATSLVGLAHRLIPNSALGIKFANGSKFEMAPRGGSAGAPFSTGISVEFMSGSTYYQGGTAAGVSEGTGSNPFNSTTASIVCDAGSVFYNWTSVYSAAARTYGNLTVDNRGVAVSPFGVTALTAPSVVNGNLLIKSTSVGSFNIVAAAAPNNPSVQIAGNFTVQSGGLFQDNYAAATVNNVEVGGNVSLLGAGVTLNSVSGRTWVLNGSAAQSFQIPDTQSIYGLTVNNGGNGATVTGNLSVRGALTLTSGNLTTSGAGNSVILANAATVTGAGLIDGNVTRLLSVTATGPAVSIPISDVPVSFQVTGVGTGSGSVTGSTTAVAASGLPGGVIGINRQWSLTSATISGYTATLVFTYKVGDLGSATESALQAAHFNGSTWVVLPSTVDMTLKTVTVTSVNSLSPWTLVDASAGVSDWQAIVD